MDHVTQQNGAMVEETTAASHHLTDQVRSLAAMIAQFRVERPTAASPRVATRAA